MAMTTTADSLLTQMGTDLNCFPTCSGKFVLRLSALTQSTLVLSINECDLNEIHAATGQYHWRYIGEAVQSAITQCCSDWDTYDEAFEFAQDLELLFCFGRRYPLGNLPKHLTKVRISETNASLKHQRQVIAETLEIRQWAITHYGYCEGMAGSVAMATTWLMQWLPAKLVPQTFHHVFLPHCVFLWQDNRYRRKARRTESGSMDTRVATAHKINAP